MSKPNPFTITFELTDNDVEQMLEGINEMARNEDEPDITVEELKSNEKLLAYFVEQVTTIENTVVDENSEFVANDGFCDISYHRNL